MNTSIKVLITGKPSIGKTTVIEKILADLTRPVGGFYTREMRQGQRRVGFEIFTLTGESGILAHIDYINYPHIGKYGVDVGTLDRLGSQALIAAIKNNRMIVIDEIGPMELLSANFRVIVKEVFENNLSVLATVVQRPIVFTEKLKMREDVKLITMNLKNRDHLPKMLLELFVDPT